MSRERDERILESLWLASGPLRARPSAQSEPPLLLLGSGTRLLDRFWDPVAGTVFDTASDAESLIVRPRDPMDNATPSGPSLAAELLTRAGHAFDADPYDQVASRILNHESEALLRYGPALGRMLSVLDRRLAPPVEVVIVGRREDDATRALIRVAHENYLPNILVIGRLEGDSCGPMPILDGRNLLDGRPAAYVCRGYTCQLPVSEPDEVRREIAACR